MLRVRFAFVGGSIFFFSLFCSQAFGDIELWPGPGAPVSSPLTSPASRLLIDIFFASTPFRALVLFVVPDGPLLLPVLLFLHHCVLTFTLVNFCLCCRLRRMVLVLTSFSWFRRKQRKAAASGWLLLAYRPGYDFWRDGSIGAGGNGETGLMAAAQRGNNSANAKGGVNSVITHSSKKWHQPPP